MDKRSRNQERLAAWATALAINVGIRIGIYVRGRLVMVCRPAPTAEMSPFDIAAHWQSLGIDARTN